jgi:polyisoprenoid-binding protein YceI
MLARITGWLTIALLALGGARVEAQVRTFEVDRASQVQFVSEAPLERITGTSSGVSGVLSVDPAQPVEARGEVSIQVASIRTGIDLRDEHLRSDAWLDAGRHPRILFALTGVTMGGALVPNGVVEPSIRGTLSVHGVTRDVSTRARVRYVPAAAPGERDVLRIQASFVVHLKDHAVSIPSIVALKVSPDIKVNVDLKASSAPVAAPEPVAPPVAETPAPEPAPVEKPAVENPAAKPDKPAARPARPVTAEKPPQPKPAPKPAEPVAAEEVKPAAKPVVQVEPEEQLKRLLRQAHYYLANDRPELAILSVQQAQKVLPLVEKKLRK